RTDMEFAIELLKATGVLLVHGSGFDPDYGAGHVRMVFLPPIETLEQAFNEIEKFVKSKQKS
ncbi:MAG: alanine aminotransferase, partial [Candidatus Bathyarchaeia archaeon]